MSYATLWASSPNAMWIGFAMFAVGLILGGFLMHRWGRQGTAPATREQYDLEKLVHAAAGVMRHLGYTHSNGDIKSALDSDMLSERSKLNVAKWLVTYDQFKWKKREHGA